MGMGVWDVANFIKRVSFWCAYVSMYRLSKGLRLEFEKRGMPDRDRFLGIGYVIVNMWDI